ncbi:MAG: Ig-like domain-containing protein [Eubacteriales bacterium]|nr:Ig-like domain-containing protein [Eubacteriales bacterium]
MKSRMTKRVLSFLIALLMVISVTTAGYVPAQADEMTDSGITFTVIGDTGNHGADAKNHTGYVYWLKDYPIALDLNSLEDTYIAKNAGDQIRAGLASAGIIADELDSGSLYPTKLTRGEVTLENSYPNGYWSVIVARPDGTFDSMSWGDTAGAAQLTAGARLIMYWCDSTTDCRVTTDENWNSSLLYDTDAVTAVSLYTDENPDEACAELQMEAGNTKLVRTRMTVPAASAVSRTLTWTSSDPQIAEVTEAEDGVQITAKAAGAAMVTASLVNTLGETIEASCTVTVTADGTEITGIAFEEGNALTLEPGDSGELTPVFTPALEEGESAPTITWNSSNTAVVTAANGELEAVGAGTAEVTASIINNRGVTVIGTCSVTVSAVALAGITAEPQELSLEKDETAEVALIPNPVNATEIPEIRWSTSSEKVATVVGNGMQAQVKAIGGGTAVITAEAGKLKAAVNVTVAGATVETVDPLKGIFVSKDAAGTVPYAIVSEPTEEDSTYVVAVPENEQDIYFAVTLEDGIDASAELVYNNYASKEITAQLASGKPAKLTSTNRLFNKNRTVKDMLLRITSGENVKEYTIHCIRETYLGALSGTDSTGAVLNMEPQTFKDSVHAYTAAVPESVTSVSLTAEHYTKAEQNVLLLNGEEIEGTTVEVALDGDETQIELASKCGESIASTYTVTVYRQGEVRASFTTTPENAVTSVYNSYGQRVTLTDGSFSGLPGEYTYTVTAAGYKAKQGSFSLYGKQNITVALDPVEEVSYTQYEATWPGLRNNANNSAVVDAPTPNEPDSAVLKWGKKFGSGYSSGATSVPILVGDYLYVYAGTSLYKLDKTTGDVLMSGPMAAASSFAINAPTYADGKIFVGLSGGKIQAFNAETLESLWLYTDAMGGQPNCSIRYDNGYVYTGFWNSEVKDAHFVCLTADDEDTTQKTEAKTASWTYTSKGGFYWAGAFSKGDYIVVCTDDGYSGYNHDTASLLVFNKVTGELADSRTGYTGDLRSDVAYDPEMDRVFFTSKGAYMYSEKIDWTTGQILTEESKAIALGGMSTSTPVIYKNRAYVGVAGTSQFGASSGHNIAVLDLTNWTIAYHAYTGGYPQTSGVLTTAYEEEDGSVYVYFFDNMTPGWLRYVKDSAGVTSVQDGYEQNGKMYAPIVFTPQGSMAQYCICSPVVDTDGTIYFKNDSAYLMAITMSQAALTGAAVSGGNAVLSQEFSGSLLNYEVAVDADAASVRLDLTAADDCTVTINGVQGRSRNITLEGEETLVTAVVANTDGKTGTYTFKIRKRSGNAELKDLKLYTSQSSATDLYTVPVTKETTDGTTEYRAETGNKTVYLLPEFADAKAAAEIKAVSGVNGEITEKSGRYKITLTGTETAELVVCVKAEDGNEKNYKLTLNYSEAKPELTVSENAVSGRLEKEAVISAHTEGAAYVYFYIQKQGVTSAPNANSIINAGNKLPAADGENALKITGLTKAETTVYLLARNQALNQSAITSVQIPAGPDYTAVNEALLTVPEDLSGYTAASAKAVEDAVAAVDRTLPADRQAEIDAMAAAIQAAVAGLKERIAVEEIKLDADEIELVTFDKTSNNTEAATKQLKAEVLPENAENKNVIWKSSDETVAAVDQNGLVTALRYGTAVITAETEDGGHIAECKVQNRFYDGVEGVKNGSNVITKNIADSINWMAEEGITTGYDRVSFGSFRTTSRADFVIFLWRYAGKPEAVQSNLKTFKDIEGKYAKTSATYQAIAWGASSGIINGYSDGTFKPTAPVNRGQVAIMLWKYAGQPAVNGTVKSFPDVKVNKNTGVTANMVKAIQWASANGLVNGYSTGADKGKFVPTGDCLRFQMSVIIYRYHKNIDKK